MKKLSAPMRKTELILGWIYFALQIIVIPACIDLANLFLGNPLSKSELNFIYFSVNFVCVIFIFRHFILENAKNALQDIPRLITSIAIAYGLYWVLSLLIGMLIAALYPDFSNVNDDSIGTLVQENSTLIGFATVVLVPITEELLYRGLFFRGLYNRSRVLAYAVSTSVFAAIHVVGYIGAFEPKLLLLCFLQYLPAGICLGLAYATANTIWAPILIHMIINLFGILAMR